MVKTENKALKPSKMAIIFYRFMRYIQVGAFLHLMAIFGLWLFINGLQILFLYKNQTIDFYFYKWLLLTWIGFVLPFFSELDAFGRYQNYKLIKDKLHINGFDYRLVRPFMYSNCQRISILTAAADLNCADKVKAYFYTQGYRWYHVFPQVWIRNPLVLFHKKFWEKILFTRYYQLKNFYW